MGGGKSRWEVSLVSSVGMTVRHYPSDETSSNLGLQVKAVLFIAPCTHRLKGNLEEYAVFMLSRRWTNNTRVTDGKVYVCGQSQGMVTLKI